MCINKKILFPHTGVLPPCLGAFQNAEMPHFDGKFIGVLPKRRSAISPENSADVRPYKTPIWAPFFVVKFNRGKI